MITITDKAKEKLKDILIDEKASLVRFGLKGGGCHGMEYYILIEQNKQDDDFEYEINPEMNFIMVVDSMSNMYLENASVDYQSNMMGEQFVFNAPNAVSKCGCNSSVSF